mmetsp:Transcript_8783/g.20114  ORF Transcript_8783/g.20114 Transcript_8783/m.20114 type:complete len:338 (-) Transcript_8783:4480-5493(-)
MHHLVQQGISGVVGLGCLLGRRCRRLATHNLLGGRVVGRLALHLGPLQVVKVVIVQIKENVGEQVCCSCCLSLAEQPNDGRLGDKLFLPLRVPHHSSPRVRRDFVLPRLLHPDLGHSLVLEPGNTLDDFLQDFAGAEANGDVEGEGLRHDVHLCRSLDLDHGRREGRHVRVEHDHFSFHIDLGTTPEVGRAADAHLDLAEPVQASEDCSVVGLVNHTGPEEAFAIALGLDLEEETHAHVTRGGQSHVNQDTVPTAEREVPASVCLVLIADCLVNRRAIDYNPLGVALRHCLQANTHPGRVHFSLVCLALVRNPNAEHGESVLHAELGRHRGLVRETN